MFVEAGSPTFVDAQLFTTDRPAPTAAAKAPFAELKSVTTKTAKNDCTKVATDFSIICFITGFIICNLLIGEVN